MKIVEWFGHTELILKGDTELALQAPTARILELIRARVVKVKVVGNETLPAYDSQSNGGVEVGVMFIKRICGRFAYASRRGSTVGSLWVTPSSPGSSGKRAC